MRALCLVAFLLFCWLGAAAQIAEVSASPHDNNTEMSLDLSKVGKYDFATITLKNVGTTPVVMPEVTGANAAPGTNSAAVVNWLRAQTGDSERALAEAAWRYIYQHMYARCTAVSPYEKYIEARIPWRIFRGYGFGCCSQAANELAFFWHATGLPSRVVSLHGHVVAEVYYQDAWHMYDANHRVFYTNLDGSVASVEDIVADPSLASTGSDGRGEDPLGWTSEQMADIYRQGIVSYAVQNYADYWWAEPKYTLEPGEESVVYSENLTADVIYSGTIATPPSVVFSGTLVQRIDFGLPDWNSHILVLSGMAPTTDSGRTVLTNTATEGKIVLGKDWPNPALSLQVDGEFYRLANSKAKILVYFSTDASHWSSPYTIAINPGAWTQGAVNLTRLARGAYTRFIKIAISGAVPGSVRIASLKVTSNVQVAKSSFPELAVGTKDDLIYRDGNSDEQARSMNVRVAVYRDRPAAAGMVLPLRRNELVPLAPSVDGWEAWLRSPLLFYPWLAFGDSTASSTLWQAQNAGASLRILASQPSAYLALAAKLKWQTATDGVTTWSLAKREPVSLKFDWVQPPRQSRASGTTATISLPGDQFLFSSTLGGTAQLLGRPAWKQLTATSLIPEDPTRITAGYGAAHLVDGDLRSLAYPGGPQIDYLLDLGTLTHVTAASLVWGAYGMNPRYVSQWALYGRRDSQASWEKLAAGGFPGAEANSVEVDAYASQLRITAAASNWIGLYEASVAASAPLHLTATSVVPESTALASYGPAIALVDANEGTLAYPGSAGIDYIVDAGELAYIDQVRVVWGGFGTSSDYIAAWRIYGQQTTGSTWEVIARGECPNSTETLIPVHREYRRLRIAADGPNWNGIYELHAYGNLLSQN